MKAVILAGRNATKLYIFIKGLSQQNMNKILTLLDVTQKY